MTEKGGKGASFGVERSGADLEVTLSGQWLFRGSRPRPADFKRALDKESGLQAVRFRMSGDENWDTSLLTFLTSSMVAVQDAGLSIELGGMPEGVQKLIDLSRSVPVEKPQPAKKSGVIEELGTEVSEIAEETMRFFDFFGRFIGEAFSLGKSGGRFRRIDFLTLLQSCGPQALPIVTLMNFLTGLIIAFIGLIQLQRFAADVYVADLVAVATTRELGAVITGVIMAGRTGAAFAAQIGTMQVNEEIDALNTFGVSPMRFLVVPRVIAMVLMMPLLVACANIVAIFAGLVVALGVSDIGFVQYREHVRDAVDLWDLSLGIFKGGLFGFIIAIAGCYRGLSSGKDAASVGIATTSAVVIAITWITIADAILAVLCNILGI